MTYPTLGLYIGGQWLGDDGSRTVIDVRNPATDAPLGRLPLAREQDLEAAVEAAHQAFAPWRAMSALARGRILAKVALAIRAHTDALARVLTLEQGKTIPESVAELTGTADTFEWMAEEGKRVYGRVVASRLPDSEYLVLREPVGPVAAFTPWNSPAVLLARKIATALAAGCPIVVKAAEEAPGICVEIVRLCAESGLPAGVVNLVFGVPDAVSRYLIASPRIKLLSFTGSVAVGRKLLELASLQMKKIELELGGHSPVIVHNDVDVARVAQLASAARFRNAGQACHGPTRFLVHGDLYLAFCEHLAARARQLRVGDGMDAATGMGPLIHQRRVQAMRAFTEDALAKGARLLCGGRPPDNVPSGNFWLPTVLCDMPRDANAMCSEVFGPLALVTPYRDVDEALDIANSVDLGLGSYAFSDSLEVLHQIQTRIQAGNLSINTFAITMPEVPFGGVKYSGMGSEMGIEGLQEYFTTKTVLRAARPC